MTKEELFDHNMEYWLEVLAPYQISIIEELYKQSNDYEVVASNWLAAFPSDTIPFGTENNKNIFYDKFLDELEAFLRGEERYKEENKELLKNSSCVQTIVVSVISSALGLKLGVAATFIAPVVVLSLGIIGKLGINAWLAQREELRNKINNNDLIN
jgi:hypothetical protein